MKIGALSKMITHWKHISVNFKRKKIIKNETKIRFQLLVCSQHNVKHGLTPIYIHTIVYVYDNTKAVYILIVLLIRDCFTFCLPKQRRTFRNSIFLFSRYALHLRPWSHWLHTYMQKRYVSTPNFNFVRLCFLPLMSLTGVRTF